VVVDGDKLRDARGKPVDADGDGDRGGVATADFKTLPLTRIKGTNVFGFVYDSYHKNPDGSNIPVVGATIRVDALPGVTAVTDAEGFFELKDMPAPEFFVHIDGTTAVNAPPAASASRSTACRASGCSSKWTGSPSTSSCRRWPWATW
jgi:hypothetical protein